MILQKEKDSLRINFQKTELLKNIANEEALQSKHGANASKLRKEYVKQHSDFQQGDKVKIINIDDKIRYGVIAIAKFETSPIGYTYVIKPTDKTFKKETKRKAFYRFYTNESLNDYEIKTIEKVY